MAIEADMIATFKIHLDRLVNRQAMVGYGPMYADGISLDWHYGQRRSGEPKGLSLPVFHGLHSRSSVKACSLTFNVGSLVFFFVSPQQCPVLHCLEKYSET